MAWLRTGESAVFQVEVVLGVAVSAHEYHGARRLFTNGPVAMDVSRRVVPEAQVSVLYVMGGEHLELRSAWNAAVVHPGPDRVTLAARYPALQASSEVAVHGRGLVRSEPGDERPEPALPVDMEFPGAWPRAVLERQTLDGQVPTLGNQPF